jgi:hypothetical protein
MWGVSSYYAGGKLARSEELSTLVAAPRLLGLPVRSQ